MDRGAHGIVNGRFGKGVSALLLLAFLFVAAGCHRGWLGGTTPPPRPGELAGDNTAPAAVMEWLPPAVPTDGTEEEADGHGWPGTSADNTSIGAPVAVAPAVSPLPAAKSGSDASSPPHDNAARSVSSLADGHGWPGAEGGGDASRVSGPSAGAAPAGAGHADARRSTLKAEPAAVPRAVPAAPPKDTRGASLPGWAKSPEELAYRVDFIGITMGYARFRYEGKVSIAGKPAYHLNVRAWTSGVLSYIFPINETIDYYLDAESLAPIRQEFTNREREKDDVALYDQETGRITYRYRQSGKIRKQVDTIPSVYDPVSVAYYFRWRDLGVETRPRNVYAGRKVYQISSRVLGNERIRTEHGEVDTIAVLPLIRRDGRPDDKGDLKIWFSNDERRVPVRLYAKFRKIKDWTLVGELMPPAGKAGG